MDNERLFKYILNNIVLRNFIFFQVKLIDKQLNGINCINWYGISKSLRNSIYHGYREQIEILVVENNISSFSIKELEAAVDSRSIDMFNYILKSNLYQFHGDELHLAVRMKSLQHVDYILENCHVALDYYSAMALASRLGYRELILYFIQMRKRALRSPGIHCSKSEDSLNPIDHASYFGDKSIVQLLLDNGFTITGHAIEEAIKGGHLALLRFYLEDQHKSCTKDSFTIAAKVSKMAMWYAAINGHLDILIWLHNNRNDGCCITTLDDACRYGHTECVKWLHQNRTDLVVIDAMINAVKNGHLDIVKYLHYNCTQFSTSKLFVDYAAKNGHLEVVKWLLENRSEGCTQNALDLAAQNGHLEIIKFLHYNRLEGCTQNAMDLAAINNHFETVKWLHENRTEGCSPTITVNVSRKGNLEILKFLFENYKDVRNNLIDRVKNKQNKNFLCLFTYVKETECKSRVSAVKNNLNVTTSCEVFPQPADIYVQRYHDIRASSKMSMGCRTLTVTALKNSCICICVLYIIKGATDEVNEEIKSPNITLINTSRSHHTTKKNIKLFEKKKKDMSKFVCIATTMVVCYCIYVVSEMIECNSMIPDIANELTEITSCDAFSSQEDLKMYRQRILNISHSQDMFIKSTNKKQIMNQACSENYFLKHINITIIFKALIDYRSITRSTIVYQQHIHLQQHDQPH
ncbi:hypothetical protein PPL_01705 [Heterostelium album PN500]|uniref:Ankyrin repeat-containing protein n=1 Tax=Heterostelium pallidum (strain ATCC 26659 / Pp 5 / PN500) TaxID=670386 RepID=D3B089_HETP5|nr:hypothetical protein PPL_01705 [Heterostelium album PN500]EFA84713.1 hypothetical protein PPL_01705 [Heterostelium album PN500]|eukprot:XP_020436826.1 hypothetical protein PPL_01705 [Heterostelium album PN500]